MKKLPDKKAAIQKYAPEVQAKTAEIVQQLPPEVNTLALQARIAEAIVQRSEARILGAINEALAYRPSPPPSPVQRQESAKPTTYNVNIGEIKLNIDNSQNINYWQDNSQHYTDNSSRNYWADNRRYEDYSDRSDNRNYEDNSSIPGIIGAIAGFWPIALVLLVGMALSSPCAQQIQEQQQQQQLPGGASI